MTRRRAKPKGKRPQPPQGRLKAALKPFADVDLPDEGYDGDCVWLYVGKPLGSDHGHLKVEDFRRARREMAR